MLNMNYKKALLAATVLTAFCANAAFAEEAPAKPTMRERVDRILHCDDRDFCFEHNRRNCDDSDHRFDHLKDCKPGARFEKKGPARHHLTDEQIKEREARREAWEKMSPEERKEAKEKWRAERKKEHDQRVADKMNKLSPEQRKEVENFIKKDRKHREEQREALRDMTPEQRDAIRAQQPHPPKPPKFQKGHHPAPHHDAPHHRGEFREAPPVK